MKMRCPALPIAVAVAACLWASGAMAQAGTMPGDGQESRPAVPAGSSAHRTWELPGFSAACPTPRLPIPLPGSGGGRWRRWRCCGRRSRRSAP